MHEFAPQSGHRTFRQSNSISAETEIKNKTVPVSVHYKETKDDYLNINKSMVQVNPLTLNKYRRRSKFTTEDIYNQQSQTHGQLTEYLEDVITPIQNEKDEYNNSNPL